MTLFKLFHYLVINVSMNIGMIVFVLVKVPYLTVLKLYTRLHV